MERTGYLTIFIGEISSLFRISQRTTRKYIRDERWDQIPPPSMRQAGRLVWFPRAVDEWIVNRGGTVIGEVKPQPEAKKCEIAVKTIAPRKGNKTKVQRILERKEADRLLNKVILP